MSALEPMAYDPEKSDEMPWDDARLTKLSRVGELNSDVMECGEPQDAWRETVKHFRWRANVENNLARELRQTADEAATFAITHAARAHDFTQLADAMERVPVTFAASADTHPKGQDRETGLGS